MSPEQINIAIAEAWGWKRCKSALQARGDERLLYWASPNGNIRNCPPNYYGDLNACHKAIWSRRNDRAFVQEFSKQLRKAVGCAEWATFALENASSEQRSEALYQTIKSLESTQ